MTEPYTLLRQGWRRVRWLEKVGWLCLGLSLAVEYHVIHTTPAALWNGPRHIREQYDLLVAQAISAALILTGVFLRQRRETAEDGRR